MIERAPTVGALVHMDDGTDRRLMLLDSSPPCVCVNLVIVVTRVDLGLMLDREMFLV